MKTKHKTSIMLSTEGKTLLAQIAAYHQFSQSTVLQWLIHERAWQMDNDPGRFDGWRAPNPATERKATA